MVMRFLERFLFCFSRCRNNFSVLVSNSLSNGSILSHIAG